MSLLANRVMRPFSSRFVRVVGAAPVISPPMKHLIGRAKYGLLVLVFAAVALSSFFNVEAARTWPPDTVDSMQLLDIRTEIVPFGPRIFGLHAHSAAPPDSRAFHASIRSRNLVGSGLPRPNSTPGNVLYPVNRHYGQPIGLDRWFSEAILPVRPAVILLC